MNENYYILIKNLRKYVPKCPIEKKPILVQIKMLGTEQPISYCLMIMIDDSIVCWMYHGLVQDGSNSSALAMEILQSCSKPSICALLARCVKRTMLKRRLEVSNLLVYLSSAGSSSFINIILYTVHAPGCLLLQIHISLQPLNRLGSERGWDVGNLMDIFVYVPSQWEMTLHCNIVSHCLGAYTK